MDLFADVGRRIADALASLKAEGALPGGLPDVAVETETPRDVSHGDVACNIAMVLAKPGRMKPRDIADKIAARLAASGAFAKVEVAGPGFLNITLKTAVWHQLVAAILTAGRAYGRSTLGAGTKVNLEYVSANPTGPMHVGHGRGAVFGDALASLLEFTGHEVTREYYINDAGGQVDMLARSAYLRYREALGEDIGAVPEGLYPGDYLKPVGEALVEAHGRRLLGRPEADWMVTVRATAIAMMLESIKGDLAALDIHHDVFFSEASLTANGRDDVRAAIEALRKDGLVLEGRLERPKGHDDEDWEDREQTLFCSTKFGDDVDRALMKSDGSYTYFASDIAYHYTKLQRGFGQLIDVFGADHVGYIPRMKAAVAALGHGKVAFDIEVCQLVKLFRAGEPVRMSKRAGTFVTLRDVVDEVGRDAVRFMMLYRKNDAPLDFDLAKVIEHAKENPVFYVQYGHARSASVLRQAGQEIPGIDTSAAGLAKADLSRLTDAGEIDIVRRLAEYPRLVTGAARAHEPHRLAFYLYELASALHQQYTRGHDSPHLRFIQPLDLPVTSARLALIVATKQVISSGLGLLGVGSPEEMR